MTGLPGDPLLIFRYPQLLFFASFFVLWLGAWIGASRFKRLRSQVAEVRDDFVVIQGATLTLLGLRGGQRDWHRIRPSRPAASRRRGESARAARRRLG